MKTNIRDTQDNVKSFRDFALFSVFVVRPGTVFTPYDEDRKQRVRISPLRKPSAPPCLSATWRSLCAACICAYHKRTALETIGEPEQITEVGEPDEIGQWGATVRRARLSWMDENPY